MTVVMRDYHGHQQELSGPTDAAEWFDEQAHAILPHGGSGQTIWFGPVSAQPELRVDIDVDADRGALRWLADGSYAVELDVDGGITVLESPEHAPTHVRPEVVRVSTSTARAAVVEYTRTHARPGCVTWASPASDPS